MDMVVAMGAVVIMLVLVHKRLRLKRYLEIREYYEEQMKYVASTVDFILLSY